MGVLMLSATFLALCLISLILYVKKSFTYWKNKKIPYEKPVIPFGTVKELFDKKVSFCEYFKNAYVRAKAQGHKHIGLYILCRPIYLPIDHNLIKNILSTDFNSFYDRGLYYNEKDDPLTAHLFNLDGQKWKSLRTKLTPTFTPSKIKMMFETLIECGNNLKSALDNFYLLNKSEAVDVRDLMSRFTTDVIGSCAFGLDCNSFKDPNSEFRNHGQKFFTDPNIQGLYAFFCISYPNLCKSLRLKSLNTETSSFFIGVIRDAVDYRERNNVRRKDFLQILIDLKNTKQGDDDIGGVTHDFSKIEKIAAQSFLFFIAGLETSSTTLSFCMYELALNPDVQEKVRHELNATLEKYDGKIIYEALGDLKYMEQVIDETLRKYPPLPYLNRVCTIDYKVPGTDFIIEKDTSIYISSLGIQNDPEYFPEPHKFDPERFSDENKSKIIPFTYLPFGHGPRICLGLKFGIAQVKVGLSTWLQNFTFSLNEKTRFPLELDKNNVLLSPAGSIWLNNKKL